MQVEDENLAVIPAGNPDVENETETALPDSSVAVMPSVVDWPAVTESVDDAAEREKLDPTSGAAPVVKVESGESVRRPAESADATR